MATLSMLAAATLVFCAPGFPGSSGDAQPLVQGFAQAAAASAGWSAGGLTATYDPTEQGGMTKLAAADAVLTFVPYPFFVEHGAALHLTPLVQADVVGVGSEERWSLVAKAGAGVDPAKLGGYTVLSVAGYAPRFVRHAALAQWTLPADVKIEVSRQVLSVLRRVGAGEHVVALLDQSQAASLASLPFASQLQTIGTSAPLPVALVAVVNGRLTPVKAKAMQAALIKMGSSPGDAETLAALQLKGFVAPTLRAARSAAP